MSQRAGSLRIHRDVARANRVATLLLISIAAAACVGSNGSPTASSSTPVPAGTQTPTTAAQTATAPTSTGLESPTLSSGIASASLAATATVTAPPGATGSAGQQAVWTGLHWTAGPVNVPENGNLMVSLAGWSRGYVVFRMTDQPAIDGSTDSISVLPSASSDGLVWTAGRSLDVTGLDAAEWVGDVVEGPAGLLASGYVEGAACGGPAPVNGMWMSSDGISWKRIALTGFGAGTVYRVEAGSVGYIATGVGPGTARPPYVWTSKDGVTWTATNLTTAAVKGVEVTNAVSFADGFVIAGGAPDPNGGCGSGTITPSLWWSANGKTWTRDAVSGTTPGDTASFRVYRISDRLLLAQESSYSMATNQATEGVWISTDGRDWKGTADPTFTANTVLSYKAKGVLISSPVDPTSHADVWDIRADLTLVKLAQSGAAPAANVSAGLVALGPAGLVACNSDGSQFWVGSPVIG